MTVYRTVQIADDQLPRFEKMMKENGFEIIPTGTPEIPIEVQEEMERRSKTWDPALAIPAQEALIRLKSHL